MTKRDAFVIIYCSIWGILITLFTTITITLGILTAGDCVIISNVLFLTTTSLFVFIKPIRKWVDVHIVSKVP